MRIAHNIISLNTLNKMNINNKQVNSGLSKLSSGLRINQAADDSAGLTISEKMRGQIRGLERAEQNIQDGISLIQTAESGLSEIANPNLLRLRELTIQAANDILNSEDRHIIQHEIEQTLKTINQIANETGFNTMNLLNGTNPRITSNAVGGSSFNYENILKLPPVNSIGSFAFGTDEGYPTSSLDNNKILVYGEGSTSNPAVRIDGVSYKLKTDTNITPTVENNGVYETIYSIPSKNVEVTQLISIKEDKYEIQYMIKNNDTSNTSIGFQFHLDTMLGEDDSAPFIVNGSNINSQTVYSGNDIPDDFIVYNQNNGEGVNSEFQAKGIIKGEGIVEEPSQFAIGRYSDVADWNFNANIGPVGDSGYSIWWNPRDIGSGGSFTVNTFYGQSVPPTIEDPSNLINGPFDIILHIGSNTDQQFKIQLSDVRVQKLGISNINVLSNNNANFALKKIDEAMKLVSTERTKYGSYQNALEHIEKNVSNYKTNLTSAESQLRDLDISKVIVKLKKDQIILQASQAMSTQANQMSQSILQLLK
ncbi:flagellin [Psychrobacillus sp. FJAT-51614]|uniref:Flagellin n=1 Tax=Psychrobacillus mangrovi TaxID=3117745 RepID=A0ABU8F3L9_9BACI